MIGEKLRAQVASPLTRSQSKEYGIIVTPLNELLSESRDANFVYYNYAVACTTFFGNRVRRTREMKPAFKLLEAAEREYMPSFPPMSPLSDTFFHYWYYYDVRIPKTDETTGTCDRSCADVQRYDATHCRALDNLIDSRMGIYEHLGIQAGHIFRLRDIGDGKEYSCRCYSGYKGMAGELWYARVVPPVLPELSKSFLVLTTPYILTDQGLEQWQQYLARSIVGISAATREERIKHLMKYGLSTNYWNEYVFCAYSNYNSGAIFLTGIPDMKKTLPHA